ncbi:hypothetical protein NQ318_022949 [Aromia moschata]|uniref:RNA helicase n=1 Tax=Aromia moschata TaxID=1265417 RepID=A0AAV8X250_9CUCU|nr:hypothetical protein NQ318_022949 [Aromia moschata]
MEINKTVVMIPEIEFVDNEQTRTLLSLFPAPKSVLNNIYDEVVKETKQKIFKVAPQFRAVKDSKNSLWVCTYHIRWPEEIKFKATDSKKRLASHKAALAALNWLKSAQKLTKKGIPVIYEKDEITKLVNKTVPVLLLDNSTLKNMQKIKELHQEQILPHIVKSQKEIDQNNNEGVCETPAVQEPDNVNLKSIKKQRYIGLNQYLAKEKIELPISAYKADFIKLLKENQIIIVKGEPGCGKSTRIPQYVLEAWAKEDGLLGEHRHIAVTQPRRIAAISLAERVSIERNESVGNIVGYQVRLKSNFRPETGRILYCTTGILLRHIQADPNLSRFTHVILDEAHERDVNTDLLMNLLRRATKTNAKLKLIIMSATIDTRMFSDYFGGVPIMDIPGFTYPVAQMCDSQVPSVIHEDVVRIMQFIHDKKKEGAILCFLPGWEDINSEQWRIFSRPPPGVRKIILATNIAETSVTIDDVVYVIDTGIHKEQRFDVDKGVNCLDNHWISKASANQRKGRAGRCQAGESFHLYPKSQYESFIEYSLPEIMRTSLTKIVLDSKVYSNNMNALEFSRQLPTCPEENAVIKAVDELVDLELLDDKENLTTLGKTVANFQLEPKLSKAMINSVIFKCVTPIVDIVTLFSAETELFVSGLMDKGEVKHVKGQFSKTSDHLAMMRLLKSGWR